MAGRSAGNLTPKQAKFVEIYLSNGRKTGDAYRRAYNTAMSNQRCNAEGGKLLKHPAIAPLVAKANARAAARVERAIDQYAITKERAVLELARLGFSNMEDFTRQVGTQRVVDFSETTREQLAAVQEITSEEFTDGHGEDARQVRRTKFRLVDKAGAIEKLARMCGWIIDKREQGRPGEFGDLSDEALEQALVDQMVARGMTEPQARALLAAGRKAGQLPQ